MRSQCSQKSCAKFILVLTSDGSPAEGDVPSQTFYEPYDDSGAVGYGSTPSTGYPAVVNNRNDQDYTNQFGILLDGTRWNARTITTAIKSHWSGTSG